MVLGDAKCRLGWRGGLLKAGMAAARPAFCLTAGLAGAGIGNKQKMLKALLINSAIYLAFFLERAGIFPHLSAIYSLFYGRNHPNGMILLR